MILWPQLAELEGWGWRLTSWREKSFPGVSMHVPSCHCGSCIREHQYISMHLGPPHKTAALTRNMATKSVMQVPEKNLAETVTLYRVTVIHVYRVTV